MIKIAKLFGLCTLPVVLLALPALAQQISYESAAVGRIVGETPDEMRGQLVADDIKLDYATYYGDNGVILTDDISRAEDVISVVQKNFPGNNDAHFVESLILGRWNWGDVKDSVGSWTKRSLFLLEAHGDVKEGVVTADSPAYFDETISLGDFNWNFKDKPLVVFDSDYAGVNVPKRDSFVSVVAGNAVVIAPTAVPDENFVKVFACNLGKYKTLGETYTNARNNYYWQSNKPSGIALMSYELYGNPASLVSVPDYDEAAISEHCGDFLKDYTEASLSPALAASSLSIDSVDFDLRGEVALPLRESRKFSIAEHSLVGNGNFSVLVTDGTRLSSDDSDLVLPLASLVQSFPLKTVVTGVDNIKFSNPVDLVIPNLPSWYGGFVERECGYESRNASLETYHAVDGNRLELFTTIRPVEVVNCSEGRLRLYTEVGFDVNYFTYSPVLISDVQLPAAAAPGEELTANVTLANVIGGSFSGELTLSDGSRVVAEKPVEFSGENELFTTLQFGTGSEEGIMHYSLAFVQNGEEKTFYDFALRVRSMDLSLQAPITAGESGSVKLLVNNHLPDAVESAIQAYVIKGSEVMSQSVNVTLLPGINAFSLSYEQLSREDKTYDFLVNVPYGSGKASASTVLVTNHPPVLKRIEDLTVTEGEAVKLSPEATDVDGDDIEVTYSGEMESGEWQTELGDAGEYEVLVTASDGLLEDSQVVGVTVLENLDVDGDGYDAGIDCNDNDASINPGAAETCDELDNNCDRNIDEGVCVVPEACQTILGQINASYLSSCGNVKYDYVADINGDKKVNTLDFSILAAHVTDSAWCSNAIAAARNPCETPTCTDSDGGKDYSAKGTITVVLDGRNRTEADYCNSDGTLREWYCGAAGDPAGLLRSENRVSCPNGHNCSDGTCA